MSSYTQRQQETADQLDEATKAFLEELEGLDGAQLDFHPEPDSWSVRDVAHHLMLVEKNILIRLEKSAPLGKPGLKDRVLHFVVKTVLRTGIKVKAPSKAVKPTDPIELADLKEQWSSCRAGIRKRLLASAAGESVMAHPIAGPLDSLAGFEFLLMHVRHHMKQVGRIRAHQDFP